MDDRIQAMAAEAARQLLQRFKQEHPEWTGDRTPIDDFLSWLGLEVVTFHPSDYAQGTYGWLEPGEDLIWLCRNLPETLRRFTLAHELGHVILHRHDGHQAYALSRPLDSSDISQAGHTVPQTASNKGPPHPSQPPSPLQSFGPGPEPTSADPCQAPDVREEVIGLVDSERAEELLGIGQSYNPRSQRELAANIFAAELLMPLERVRSLYLKENVSPRTFASIFDVSAAAMLNRLAGLLEEPTMIRRGEGGVEGMGGPLWSPGAPGWSPGAPGNHPPNTDQTIPPTGHTVPQTASSKGPPHTSPPPSPLRTIGQISSFDVAYTSPHVSAPATKKQYDEFQQAAIEASTPALIVAGPGSGKTSTLIGRVEYLIRTLEVEPQHILALTFSRKAAQEMRDRLQEVLKVETAIPVVSTFHAFCAELLRMHGGLVGLHPNFAFVDEAEGYFLLRRLARELPLRHYQNLKFPALYFPAILSAISRAKDELVTPEQYRHLAQSMLDSARSDEEVERAEKALEIAEIYALYQAGLQRQGDTDFGGLIMLAVQLLQEHGSVSDVLQQQYQHILVDEFQDINRASGVLLRLLAGEQRRVWVVGDANQAIYSFRGASPANIANFREDYPDAVVLPLSRNYRSRPDIVSLADAFRRKQLEPDGEVRWTGEGNVRSQLPDPYVTLAVATDEASELNGLLADIQDKHSQGYSYNDMVVLCRTRAQARKITQALMLADLPVLERGGLLEQEHVKDVLSMLLLFTDRGSKGLLRVARQSEHPLTQNDIEALLLAAREQKCSPLLLIYRDEAPLTMSANGRRSITRLSNILQALQRAPDVWSLLAQYLFIETSLARELLCAPDNTRANAVLDDYASLLSLARYYDQAQQAPHMQKGQVADTTLPSIQEQIKGFLDYVQVLLTLRQDGGSRREGTEGNGEVCPDVIRVMTVHASKGLEFPVVYLPGLVQRRFPTQKRSSPVSAPVGMLPPESEDDAVHESGEACLFYVGATRARDHLVLSYSERYGKQKYSRSPYIDALVAGLPDERITSVLWQEANDQADQSALGEILRYGRRQAPPPHSSPLPPLRDDIAPLRPLRERGVNEPLSSSQPSQSFIDAMKPQTLSVSAIETYATCPRRYAYSYIYSFESDKGAYQLFWQATQKTFETLRTMLADAQGQKAGGRENGEIASETSFPTRLEAQDLFTQHWRALGGDEFPFASIYEEHGREVIDLVWSRLAENADTQWELRQSVHVDVAGKTVHVDIDRVEAPTQSGNGAPVEPVKFVRTHYGKRKDKPTASTREMLYARAYRQLHPGRNIELHGHNMSTGETFQIKLTEKREQKLYDELEQLIVALENNEFPPKPDAFVCPACPFFLICPA